MKEGKNVMIEKKKGEKIQEVNEMERMDERKGVQIYEKWNQREDEEVGKEREFLKEEIISQVQVEWKEDVRKWKKGKKWIWEKGGIGVLDKGINEMQIVKNIMKEEFLIKR